MFVAMMRWLLYRRVFRVDGSRVRLLLVAHDHGEDGDELALLFRLLLGE